MSKVNRYYCVVSGKPISAKRVKALLQLGIPKTQWTLVEYSIVRKKKGIFLGEHGTSELKLVDKVYNDSVRAVFQRADTDSEGPLKPENLIVDDPPSCDNMPKGEIR